MKLQKAEFVGFLVALGFTKAANWDEDILIDRAKQTPDKVPASDVPEEHTKLYNALVAAKESGEVIEIVGGESAAPAKKAAAAAKSAPAAKESGEVIEIVGGESAAPAKKAAAPAKKPEAKSAPAKAAKKEKPARTPKPEKEKDAFGSIVGTIRSNLNLALTKDWLSEEELAQAAGVTGKQARTRLRRMRRGKLVEARRRTEYRWVATK